MSQTQNLFPAQAKGVVFSAATSAPTPLVMKNPGNTVRICNEGSVAVYCAFGTSASDPGAIATLPGDGLTTSCFVPPNGDVRLTLPSSSTWYASAITRSSTAVVVFYVNEGM